jgi:tetraprenyl-beta-curcumene synthase
MEAHRIASAGAFTRAARRYWLSAFPLVCRELRRRHEQATAIPDPALRSLALQALDKRGNMEGAAAFATFVPRRHHAAVVRATVAFQSAYNYLDVLSEQPVREPLLSSRALHEALLVALRPGARHARYYEHFGRERDGGYLAGMVDDCRAALSRLPGHEAVTAAALRAAERVVAFQCFQAGADEAGNTAMQRWGAQHTPPETDLRWWEVAGSAGSSLGVHVMIATAAEQCPSEAYLAGMECAYFPWIGALHTMLDHLVDGAEDAASAQRNLTDFYGSQAEAAERMRLLAEQALRRASALAPKHRHPMIVAAMASFYLAAPQAQDSQARAASQAVLEVFGSLATPALAVFKARRLVERVYYASRAHGDHDAPAQTIALLPAGH